jgi:glycosyltransferase EpsD
MAKEKFDLIHCHMPITGILTRMAAHKTDKSKDAKHTAVLYTAHGFHFFKGAPLVNWLYYLPERFFARYTDCLILINREDYDRARRFPLRGSVEYIPGVGISPLPEMDATFNLRTHFNIPEDHKIAVSVGELSELKNHITAIKAMDCFRRDAITYIICGQGALENELKRTVMEMHLEHRVIFAGYCTNIPDILRQSDLFIFPSVREGLPVAMMEAMQAGLPVIAADIRGNHDLIEDGKGGFLFDENLTADYVRAIRYFLDYPDEAVRMGEWNKERIKNFSLDIVNAKMREIYTGIADSRNSLN